MRRSTIVCGLVAAGIGSGLFQLKYEVMRLEQQYRQICQAITVSQESTHVLRAEWAHLNGPERLQELAGKYLDIAPVAAAQLTSLDKVAGGESNYDRDALEKLVAEVASDSKSFEGKDE